MCNGVTFAFLYNHKHLNISILNSSMMIKVVEKELEIEEHGIEDEVNCLNCGKRYKVKKVLAHGLIWYKLMEI